MKPQIVNIVNFVRGCEPRYQVDLVKPVEKQLELMKHHALPGTFLLQYDALVQEQFSSLFKNTDVRVEVGLWLEMCRPLVEQAGLAWRGRPGWAWDYHSDVGFTVGYQPEERITLVDACFHAFKEVFDRYPSSVGSWFIDAITLEYMKDRYGLAASCNCKDQWGTDGYSVWGGYYGQAYYPSRGNMLCPAQSLDNQISVPVFRMLGSDPIYQYDAGSTPNELTQCQPVVTLEPVYAGDTGGGGDPDWVRWYMKENFNGICLSFGYTQAGQENSFGWEPMENGLNFQFSLFAALRDQGRIKLETMEQTGLWYQKTFPLTPASAIVARTDWKHQGRQSCWYSSQRYRTNLFFEEGGFRIRDLTLFDERYQERYLTAVCDTPAAHYDNLPLMDGHRWSGNGVKAGLWLCDETGVMTDASEASFLETGNHVLTASFSVQTGGSCTVVCQEDRIRIDLSGYPQGQLQFRWDGACLMPVIECGHHCMRYLWNGFSYTLGLSVGRLLHDGDRWSLLPDSKGIIELLPGACLAL